MKKWLVGVLTSVLVIAALVAFRDHVKKVWAAPNEVETVKKDIQKHEDVLQAQTKLQEDFSKWATRYEERFEAQQQVQQLQVENLKEQLELIKELKK